LAILESVCKQILGHFSSVLLKRRHAAFTAPQILKHITLQPEMVISKAGHL
jgi:hypothetical protein